MENPEKQESSRNPDGTFVKGVSGNPAGRPKGKTIKERVIEWLETHPDDMASFVEHFVKNDRQLAWRMLEGNPANKTDLTSGGKPIPILGGIDAVPKDDGNGEDSKDA